MNINDLVAENEAARAADVANGTPAETAGAAADFDINDPSALAEAAEAGDGTPEASGEAAALKEEIAKLKEEAAQKDDQILRQKAEFQNFRRRTQQEKAAVGQVVTENIFKALLPTLDNLERAVIAENGDYDTLKKGVELILREFGKVLADNGLAVIETAGKEFDPNFHQAVMRVQNPDFAENTIAAELQKGYTVNGTVIRPSMVQVVAN